jgi:hypothetical protein
VGLGGHFLGLAETPKEAVKYIEWHKRLMANFTQSRTVKAITPVEKERQVVTQFIRDALTKQMLDQHIPQQMRLSFLPRLKTLQKGIGANATK